MKKVALITGITGQDGSISYRIFVKEKYVVHGIKEDHQVLILIELIIYLMTNQ